MLIDCDTCVGRGIHCGDCVITVLLRRPPVPVELDDDERSALGSLADAGLVPPLRMVPAVRVVPATMEDGPDTSDSPPIVRGIA